MMADELKRLYRQELDKAHIDPDGLARRTVALRRRGVAGLRYKLAFGLAAAGALGVWLSRPAPPPATESPPAWTAVLDRALAIETLALAEPEISPEATSPSWLPREYVAVADMLEMDVERW
jgi:hypothetical protein